MRVMKRENARKIDNDEIFARMPLKTWKWLCAFKKSNEGTAKAWGLDKIIKMRAAVGKGLSVVRAMDRRLWKAIGKLDIDYEESEPGSTRWQAMLKGLKPGDLVRIINLVEKEAEVSEKEKKKWANPSW